MIGIFKTLNRLESSKPSKVILEGKYDLDENEDEIENDSIKNDEQDNNLEEDIDNGPDDSTNEDDNTDNVDDMADDDYSDDSDTDQDNDFGGGYDDNPFDDEDPDNTESDRSSPDIKVLTMTEQEKNLANLRLMDDIAKLKRNIQNSIDTVSGLYSHSKEHNIISEEVLTSLADIQNDVNNLVAYRLSDVYETNVKSYLGLLERYSMVMELYKRSHDTYMSKEQ